MTLNIGQEISGATVKGLASKKLGNILHSLEISLPSVEGIFSGDSSLDQIMNSMEEDEASLKLKAKVLKTFGDVLSKVRSMRSKLDKKLDSFHTYKISGTDLRSYASGDSLELLIAGARKILKETDALERYLKEAEKILDMIVNVRDAETTKDPGEDLAIESLNTFITEVRDLLNGTKSDLEKLEFPENVSYLVEKYSYGGMIGGQKGLEMNDVCVGLAIVVAVSTAISWSGGGYECVRVSGCDREID
ncbi:hypothetical protein PFJ87_04g02050 [Encephalitozoon hellem]|uniref:Uncharacterized protein n=1 Tax=Encephalitozoon hellem TaxID=27973 RepID=A0ABY8CHH5_ENCHE|nr:hypothetical protein PFJ87_02g01820 [Encephalitozoon hellem]WEL38152.1 hypothetical protein PFJ87_03g00080 [Encephalitozoon hellem]WEL38328.1 hypothetical protein PFJ87_03g01880 [Encephalitozoon hellem]WEL38529.1 hypothetical protein PFJ87_04g02050 [Encephalitozoon hellem]